MNRRWQISVCFIFPVHTGLGLVQITNKQTNRASRYIRYLIKTIILVQRSRTPDIAIQNPNSVVLTTRPPLTHYYFRRSRFFSGFIRVVYHFWGLQVLLVCCYVIQDNLKLKKSEKYFVTLQPFLNDSDLKTLYKLPLQDSVSLSNVITIITMTLTLSEIKVGQTEDLVSRQP